MLFISSKISRSGFSGERVFRVTLPDGTEHVGISPRHYCRTAAGAVIGKNDPAPGERIEGLVEAELIKENGDKVIIAVPDGESIVVTLDQLKEQQVEQTRNVPLRS